MIVGRTWPPERVAQLVSLRQAGLSLSQIGKRLGVSREAAGGAVRRYIKGEQDYRTKGEREEGLAKRRLERLRNSARWTEECLTEPWVAYRARKRAERASAG